MELKESFKLFLILCCFITVLCLDFKYHTHSELTDYLKNFTNTRKTFFSRLYSIGKSVEGRDLWVLELAASEESKLGTPNVKLIGNIHGNEPAGREVLLHFIEYLADEYENKNETVRWILENTRIHVLPSMNPDGFEISSMGLCAGNHGRTNSKLIDLNRNFPDFYKPSVIPLQPEVLAIERWMQQIPFILSANFHGGAVVANYPFDTVKVQKWEQLLKDLSNVTTHEEELKLRQEYIESLSKNAPSITPDDDVFVQLAKTYSLNHPTMHQGYSCPDSNRTFKDGITNGAEWYPIRGSMQDYNYFKHGCMELSLEISCCKYPFSKKLPKIWMENNGALIHYVIQANKGVAGQILDQETKKPVPFASLKIVGREMNFTSTRNGEFWRILLPGSYRLEIQAWGYHGKRTSFTVEDNGKDFPSHTYLQIYLRSLISRTTETSTSLSPVQSEDENDETISTIFSDTTTTIKTTTTVHTNKEYQAAESPSISKDTKQTSKENNAPYQFASAYSIIVAILCNFVIS